MADTEKNNGIIAGEESVDDILAGILNPDGSFNDEFNGLLKKYVGAGDGENPFAAPAAGASEMPAEPAAVRTEAPSVRVEYEKPIEIDFSQYKDPDERIEEKIPENVRASYYAAASEAQRPEFTSTGDVRYPVMGVGAAEERVIFDADWEETARKEAQRLERVRQDRMLRGDSAYGRGYLSSQYARNNLYVNNPEPASEYIDPLSRDDDFERVTANSQYYSSSRKSFFPEGFSVSPKNNTASGGKTDRSRSTRSMYSTMPVNQDKSWLQVEVKPQKKRMGLFGKKKSAAAERESVPSVEEAIEQLSKKAEAAMENSAGAPVNAPVTEARADCRGDEITVVEQETQGLRSTVAEIVDKYKKRSEEDERRRIAEEVRLEDERREAELRERRRLEEIRLIKENMSRALFDAVESADSEDDLDEYEDFSTEPQEEKKAQPPHKVYGVVFNPDAMEDENEGSEENGSGSEYTEKI